MAGKRIEFYQCPICFKICNTFQDCHAHNMVHCYVEFPDDERRKPVKTPSNVLLSRAPRWYLEAVGRVKPEPD
jgi:hypothetical protein